MVATNGLSHNNIHHNGTNGHTLTCESDYPVIDMVPFVPAPKPAWRDQFALFTETVQWLDPDGISHSMTLRSDDLTSLMADLKLLKRMILASREQHAESHTNQNTQAEAESIAKPCEIHGVLMKRRNGKNGALFYSHQLPGGQWCHGEKKRR